MKDTQFEDALSQDTPAHSAAYVNGVRRMQEAERKRIQSGYSAMVAAAGMAGGFHEKGKAGPVTVAARSFCILFAFLTPSLLLIKYVL